MYGHRTFLPSYNHTGRPLYGAIPIDTPDETNYQHPIEPSHTVWGTFILAVTFVLISFAIKSRGLEPWVRSLIIDQGVEHW